MVRDEWVISRKANHVRIASSNMCLSTLQLTKVESFLPRNEPELELKIKMSVEGQAELGARAGARLSVWCAQEVERIALER